MDNIINIALPKGRLGENVYAIFERAGYGCPSILENNRKLIFESENARYFWVKPADVAVYVELGAADVGVVGSDVLEETLPDIYELSDLGVGRCRMMVAAKKGFRDDTGRVLRVATKYPHTAARYYNSVGRDISVIKLNGSIELAPILRMSDVIVDIVETGKTLKENDLETLSAISEISARLIANKASFRFKNASIAALSAKVSGEIAKENVT